MKNIVFQVYDGDNVKYVASERESSNILPEVLSFPNTYINIYFIYINI